MHSKGKFDYSILLFIFLPILLFWAKDITVTFYNNDDLYIKLLASGEFTGSPEAHLLHIGYFTSAILNILYKLLPSIPWYGLLLFSYGYLCIMLSLYILSKQIKRPYLRIFFSLTFSLISFTFLWIHIIELQYTTITAIVCALSLVCFYLSEESENIPSFIQKNILSIVTFFLALELRNKACIMFIPIFILIGLVKCIKNHKMFKPILAYFSILLLVVILSYTTKEIAYSADEWKSFRTYNTARENIVDYNGFPDYKEYQADYESLGVSFQSYISATTRYHLLLDDNINTEFMVKMDSLSPDYKPTLKEMFHGFFYRHVISYMDRPVNLIVYVFYLFVFLFIFVSKRWDALLDLSALFIGRMTIWTYLLFINRPIHRVTQGVYIVEFLLLLSIFLGQKLCFTDATNQTLQHRFSAKKLWHFIANKKLLPKRIVLVLFLVTVIFTTVKFGIPHISMISGYSKERIYFSLAYADMRKYFYEHENNLYLLDSNSFSSFTEDVFASPLPSHSNFVPLGNWLANSPWTDNIASRRNITSYEEAAITQDNIYFVFMNTDSTNYLYLENYFKSKYPNITLVICDTVYTSNGLEFYVLQARNN